MTAPIFIADIEHGRLVPTRRPHYGIVIYWKGGEVQTITTGFNLDSAEFCASLVRHNPDAVRVRPVRIVPTVETFRSLS